MKKFLMISLILLAIFLSSGSASAHRFGFGVFVAPPILLPPPLLSITEGTILHPATMDQIIITVILIEFGSRATGRRGGLPMVGKGPGFQAIGDMAPNGQGAA